MKVTKYNTNNGQGKATLSIKFDIDKEDIIESIISLIIAGNIINKPSIEKHIKHILSYMVIERRPSFGVDEEEYIDNVIKATEIAKQLYPEFFIDYRD